MQEYFEDEERIYVCFEYCRGGELYNEINLRKKNKQRFTEVQVASIIFQLAKAIAYLHANNIVHRDIKPENILFVSGPPGKGDMKIKVIDFGTAYRLKKGETLSDFYGSPNYVAPEVIRGRYDLQCDCWSVGVILYIMLTMKLPFDGLDDADVFHSVLRNPLDFDTLVSKHRCIEAIDLTKRLLFKSPDLRLSGWQAATHKWLTMKGEDPAILKFVPIILQNIRSFKQRGIVQRSVLDYFLRNLLSAQEEDLFKEIFFIFNRDLSGELSRRDLLEAFWSNGIKDVNLYEID